MSLKSLCKNDVMLKRSYNNHTLPSDAEVAILLAIVNKTAVDVGCRYLFKLVFSVSFG